ncbi:MAG: dienelactone hydrolase family protein [Janthinobacterium lividum]
MAREQVSIQAQEGDCRSWVFTPNGQGPWPAVIFYMDGLAIRPALLDMAERLASSGYLVLLPDLFYRVGPYALLDPKAVFASGDVRKAIGHLLGSTDNRRASADTAAFLAYLDGRSDVAGDKVGATGYCMGGAIALTAAGTYPDRIAAAASFHGGNLATDDALSPHHLAPAMTARIYVAGADQDKFYPPEMAERLQTALTSAGVNHHCEVYAGALHGWTMTDFPVYDEPAAERHWNALLALLKNTMH